MIRTSSCEFIYRPAMDTKRVLTRSDYPGRNSPKASRLRGLSSWFVSTLQLQNRPLASTRTAPCFTSAFPSPMLLLGAAREVMCEGRVTQVTPTQVSIKPYLALYGGR